MLRHNIVVLLIPFLRLVGFVTYSMSFTILLLRLFLSIVTMLVPFIWSVTLCITSALNILRSTFTLFVKRLNVVMFGYFMFQLVQIADIFTKGVGSLRF